MNAVNWSPQRTPVGLVASADPERAYVRIIDHGPGIPIAQRERVFMPFSRLGSGGRSSQGLGLGLALARGLVHAFDADITIEDTAGGGATFVFARRTARHATVTRSDGRQRPPVRTTA